MHAFFLTLSRAMALAGGIVLSVLILMTCVSILGRSMNGVLHSDMVMNAVPGLASGLLALGIGPVNGDFELVEAGMSFAVFAFLPLCQINGAHASVDIFTAALPRRFNRALRLVIEVIFAAVLVLIAWQLAEGMLSKQRSGQTTLLLEFPIWWSYAGSLVGAVVAASVGVYLALLRIIEVATGRVVPPAGTGADH